MTNPPRAPVPERRRALSRQGIALALTIAVHILIIVLLVRLAPMATPVEKDRPLTTITLLPEPEPDPAPTSRTARVERARGGSARRAPTPPVSPPPPPPAPDATPSLGLIPLSREEFAAADIGKIPARPGDRVAAGGDVAGTGAGSGRGDSQGVGTGPGGETLYNAEWFREPTQAELGFYKPRGGMQNGWGMIACRTVPNWRVEDCVELGQSPSGSGLAGVVRQAAWQFRVRPPRIGGKPLVGAWVRIRIDFTEKGAN